VVHRLSCKANVSHKRAILRQHEFAMIVIVGRNQSSTSTNAQRLREMHSARNACLVSNCDEQNTINQRELLDVIGVVHRAETSSQCEAIPKCLPKSFFIDSNRDLQRSNVHKDEPKSRSQANTTQRGVEPDLVRCS
jgi:hypothetical protein